MPATPAPEATATVLRPNAETQYASELEALAAADTHPRPPSWRLSPWAVRTYLMGGTLPGGFVVTPKYIGAPRLMEIAIATLATDRALLLVGAPGTAKSWVSEHLAAAISGSSLRLVQGTAGTDEPSLRFGWNYARLLAEGPSKEALVPSPIFTAMRDGAIARIEELTRIPAEVMDTLITVLSEKIMPVAELGIEIAARPGFNIIATANTRDRGVNELSAALQRRFNVVVLPTPETIEQEVAIVERRVADLGRALALPAEAPAMDEVRRVVTIFRELRDGKTADGKTKLKSPSGAMSTADAIGVMTQGMSLAAHFGDGSITAADLAGALEGAIVKDPTADRVAWEEYLRTVVKERDGWKDLYRACQERLG